MAEICASAMHVVQPFAAGLHRSRWGPRTFLHSSTGLAIERGPHRARTPRPCERISVNPVSRPVQLETLIMSPGTFPVDGTSSPICYIDGRSRKLTITSRVSRVEADRESGSLTATASYLLEVTEIDDELRAQVGTTEIAAPRNAFRAGRMAPVAQGPAFLSSLRVDGLDAHRFELMISGYDGFASHVASWRGSVGEAVRRRAPTRTPTELRNEAHTSPKKLWHWRYRCAPSDADSRSARTRPLLPHRKPGAAGTPLPWSCWF